jgi:putative flippase GtrA
MSSVHEGTQNGSAGITPTPANEVFPRPSQRSLFVSFLRFGGLSGLGWLLDFGLLFALVRWAHLPVFTANLISATTAATIVFLLSRKLVFRAESTFVLMRVLVYCGYTLIIIVLASIAMKYVVLVIASASGRYHLLLAPATCALVAKVIVTPANFLLNFVVARFTSEHGKATL